MRLIKVQFKTKNHYEYNSFSLDFVFEEFDRDLDGEVSRILPSGDEVGITQTNKRKLLT